MHPKLFTRCEQISNSGIGGTEVDECGPGQSVNKKVYSVLFVILFSMLEPHSLVCLQRDC